MQPFTLPEFYVPWPARLNPNLEAARIHSKAWAREIGILEEDGIWSESAFDRHDYALLCAYIHPEAPTDELNLMCDWNVWAFYVDDFFLQVYKQKNDRAGAKTYLDRVLHFMPLELSPTPAPTNPMERALANLWQRTALAKSTAWRSRIIESTRSLLQAFLWELDSMKHKRLANPIEYIEMRRQVGAALWSADLVEHAMFVEIPERIVNTRPIQVLKNTFADAVHLRNDIFSYEREVLKESELTNAVLVFERFLNVSTQRAADLVNDLLTSRLQQFEHTVLTELAEMFQQYALNPLEQVSVLHYIRGLQDWQSGAHEWHIVTSRYLNPGAGQTNNASRFPAGLPGIGGAVIHITPGTFKMGMNRFKNYQHTPYKKVGPTHYPQFYMPFKVLINHHLENARKNTKIWARQMGMFEPVEVHPGLFLGDERSFDATDVAFFSSLAHSTATAVQLDLYACWLIWGIYVDDYFVEVYGHSRDFAGAKMFQARLLAFMPLELTNPTPTPPTPVERGLAHLWALTTQTMSLDERCLFQTLVNDLITSWLWELSNRVQNRVPDPIDYIEMRRKTVAADFMLVLIRSLQAPAIPPEVFRTLTMQQLNNVAMDYAGLNNDIVSYQKEIECEGDANNGVLVIEKFLLCDKMQAVEIVNNLSTVRIKQFEYIVKTELPLLFENFHLDTGARKQLLDYVGELQSFIYASLQWHLKTGRYKESEFRRFAKPFNFAARPSGPGTSAAHILEIIGKRVIALQPQIAVPPIKATPKMYAVSHLSTPFAREK